MENSIEIKISDKLLEEFTIAIKQAVKEELPKYQDSFRKDWLTTEEVMELLNVSRRTLQNYRKEGKISYTQLTPKGKILYPRDGIEELLKNNMVKSKDEKTDSEILNPFLQNLKSAHRDA